MPKVRIHPRPALRLCAFLLVVSLALMDPQRASASRITPGHQNLVFVDHFKRRDWGRPGSAWCTSSSAYPNGRTNRRDRKLDSLTPRALSVTERGLQFRAVPVTRTPAGSWATGLITTEPSDDGSCGGSGFTLRADDYVQVHLRLPNREGGGGHGAWPGVWTWKDGGNEIDILEWHSEAPDRAEVVNHVGTNVGALVPSRLLGYGRWVYVGARIGTRSVTWYIGDSPRRMRAVYSDRVGVPADWRAYLVINLSISEQPGRTPTRTTPVTADVDSVRVYR